jgi:hypothetical protein
MKKLLSLSLILSLIVPSVAPLAASLAVETPVSRDATKISLDNDLPKLNFNTNENKIIQIADDRDQWRNNNRRHDRVHRWNDDDWERNINRYRYRHNRYDWRPNANHFERWNNRYNWRNNRRYNARYRTIINYPYYYDDDWNDWWWNDGRRWHSDDNYWGGGFWGNFLASMVTLGLTSAIINADNSNDAPNYVVIKENSPGYYLFNNYGLTQVECDTSEDLVFIYGPQNSLICAFPNDNVPAGNYDVNQEGLLLVPRN